MPDTTPRDQIAQIIAKHIDCDVWGSKMDCGMDYPSPDYMQFGRKEHLADAIIRAGWRPPAADSEPDEGESAGASTSEILRYEISIDDSDYVVPTGHIVLVHAHRQCLGNRLEVWIQVADGETRTQTVRVFGTGQLIPAGWRPLGSCVAGPFVWHLCGVE